MSWPSDGHPRFKLTNVKGFGGEGGNAAKLGTVWQVLDRATAYRTVLETSHRSYAVKACNHLNAGGSCPRGYSELGYKAGHRDAECTAQATAARKIRWARSKRGECR